MGLDIHYQAMPEACNLLTRARHEPDFGPHLEFFKSYALNSQQELDKRANDHLFVEFIYEVRQSLKQYPGIEQRNLYLGRRWDMLYYLLSERRRNGEANDGSEWSEKAIFGDEVLNEKTQTTVGFPIRYLYPREVSNVRDYLGTITIEMLHAHWHPRKMSEARVYKIHIDDGENYFRWIKEDFEKLKAFYALVAEYSEGILSFIG